MILKNKYIIPDINTSCTNLANGINRDLDKFYKSVENIFFDIVIEQKEENLFSALILDNKYKLSKTIIDTDFDREAVIIPLRIKALKIDKFKDLEFEKRYYLIRRELHKRLFKIYKLNIIEDYLRINTKHINDLKRINKDRF